MLVSDCSRRQQRHEGWCAQLALFTYLALLAQLGLSRVREFNADLEAVRFTGDPARLASAEVSQRCCWAQHRERGRSQRE